MRYYENVCAFRQWTILDRLFRCAFEVYMRWVMNEYGRHERILDGW